MDHFKKLGDGNYQVLRRNCKGRPKKIHWHLLNEEVFGYHNESNFSSLAEVSLLDVTE